MRIEKIEVNGRAFLKVELMPVYQKSKRFYVAKVPAKYFLELYTVEPAEYDIQKESAIADSFKEDNEYYNYLIEEDKKRIDVKAFERKESKTRIKKIRNFLNTEEFALFPNAIIVTCDLINDIYDISSEVKFSELETLSDLDISKVRNLSFLEISDNRYFLYIPYIENSILIIDGQHRLKGLKEADHSVQEKYELLVTFILQFDRPVLAKLFYTINYTQKSVNKSLLYHLTGEFSREIDVITFWHEVVKMLNELKNSPFYKRIKMLGIIPKELTPEERRLMTVSQAFLIDYLKETTSAYANRSIHQPIFLYYYQRRELQIEIIRFLIKYFHAIVSVMGEEWGDSQNSMISKTVSVGALIKMLHFLFVKIFFDQLNGDPSRIKELTKENIATKLRGIENIDLSTTGEYGGVGSAGSVNKLKKELIENIEYFEAENYEQFLRVYKENYWKKFDEWLKSKNNT